MVVVGKMHDMSDSGGMERAVEDSQISLTHFNFQHRVFSGKGSKFILNGSAKIPIFQVALGDLHGVIEIAALQNEFNIGPDTHDGKLLGLAVAGLRYVPDIKPGDSIPSEVLTGKASWSVKDKHRKIAEQRLQIQLLSWVSGKETVITDPVEIGNFLAQIENRDKLRSAFREAAVVLGFGASNVEEVVKLLELLAREVCYIEGLRDRFAMVQMIVKRLAELAKSYGNDPNAKLELRRIQALVGTGIKEYSNLFLEVDGQTAEIIAALKTLERQISYIRKSRDDLHFLLMQWEPHIRSFENLPGRRTPESDKATSALYRFLAPRFTEGKSLLKNRQNIGSAAATTSRPPPR